MKIQVSNLFHGVTEEDLRQAFGAFGEGCKIKLVRKRETAIVEMPGEMHARRAIMTLRARNLKGKPIKCTRPDDSGSSGGPRRHARDRRGGHAGRK